MFLFSLLYGIGAAVAAGTIQQFLLQYPSLAPGAGTTPLHLTGILLLLAAIEETAKTAAVAAGIARVRWHTLIHALLVGAGFVAFEAALIGIGYGSVTSAAMVGSLVIHTATPLTAAAVLLYLADWPVAARLGVGVGATTLLHAAYNILAATAATPSSPAVLLVLGAVALLGLASATWLLRGARS